MCVFRWSNLWGVLCCKIVASNEVFECLTRGLLLILTLGLLVSVFHVFPFNNIFWMRLRLMGNGALVSQRGNQSPEGIFEH